MTPLVFRAAEHDDHSRIVTLTRDIWGGDDYLADVWHDWIEAQQSVVRVGVWNDQLVAAGRVVELEKGYWWIEGLRVSPAHQGQGFATQLVSHLMEIVHAQPGATVAALTTDWDNLKIQHLATRNGMRLVQEHRYWRSAGATPSGARLTPITMSADELWAKMHASQWLTLTDGHVLDGWVARPVRKAWVEQRISEGGLYRFGNALALTGGGSRGLQAWLYWVAGGTFEEQSALVRLLRHIVPLHRNYESGVLRLFAPNSDDFSAMLAAGDLGHTVYGEYYLHHYLRYL